MLPDDPAANQSPSSAPRRRKVRVTLLVVSTLMTLLALEGGARLYAKLTDQSRAMTFDAELGWRPLPNVRKIGTVWARSVPAATNSHGWRDQERTLARTPGTRRVVAIGDSFTFGTEVDDHERFTNVLQTLVKDLEVLNLGVAGYGTDQELRLLETHAFRYQPDAIVLTVCVYNDLDDITYAKMHSWPKPYYTLEGGALRLWKPRSDWMIRARTSSYLWESLYQRLSKDDRQTRVASGGAPAQTAQLFDALIGRIAELAAGRGVALVAVMAYAPEGKGEDVTRQAQIVAESLARARIPTVDTRRLFADEVPEPDRVLYGRLVHWNAQGHALVARAVGNLLSKVGIGP